MRTTSGRTRFLISVGAVAVCGLLSADAYAEPGGGGQSATGAAPERVVDFGREVRPILSDNCFSCHGPDEGTRQRGLRLDVPEGLFEDRGRLGGAVVVAGNASESRLVERLVTGNNRLRMPQGADPLTDEQIETLRLWVEQGAEWETHWAFIPPERPALPPVADPEWVRNAIDNFVLARLEAEGLGPAVEADRATLLRRATLDLTGLPPAPGELAAFLNDDSPDAYEAAVDRLLGSPRYGERMAVEWLDAARYADTNGYQTDGERIHVAVARLGDRRLQRQHAVRSVHHRTARRRHAARGQRAISGSPRPSTGTTAQNGEGGIVVDEFLVEYAVDRVETTSTVWLGLTLGCARCHDHKFDPI